jgi:hypothetical protein
MINREQNIYSNLELAKNIITSCKNCLQDSLYDQKEFECYLSVIILRLEKLLEQFKNEYELKLLEYKEQIDILT